MIMKRKNLNQFRNLSVRRKKRNYNKVKKQSEDS